jgi:hypothetical protein
VKVGGLGRSSFGICIGESTSDVAVVDLLRFEDDESVDEVENRSPILGEKPCRPEPEGRSRPPSATRFISLRGYTSWVGISWRKGNEHDLRGESDREVVRCLLDLGRYGAEFQAAS